METTRIFVAKNIKEKLQTIKDVCVSYFGKAQKDFQSFQHGFHNLTIEMVNE